MEGVDMTALTTAKARTSETGIHARNIANRSPAMFIVLFAAWLSAMAWFGPRLIDSMQAASGPVSTFAQGYFVFFVGIAWLYGMYNVAVVSFALIARWLPTAARAESKECSIPVAVLYTTCNDFVEAGATSCARMKYPKYRVYILDDSSDPAFRDRVDRFARRFGHVEVVRRPSREGFKAGNLNHALRHHVTEPYFVIADSDEIMPRDFLTRLVPRISADPNCGFIQANHKCIKHGTKLQRDMCRGIDIHWKWYQPLRNHFGFVMFLGHGAILRTSCWEEVGGFPELVSEDLAYAIAIRERGYYGTFAEDVTCLEEFPESVRAFRVRHAKWTRGTCEFLHRMSWPLIRSRNISTAEKLDILFPTANLPLTMFFFVFMIMTAIVLPLSIGERATMTLELGGSTLAIPVMRMPEAMNVLYTWDFFAMTLVALVSPLLCFVFAMWHTPIRLLRFLVHSTSLYAALAPLSTICVLGYLKTRSARFLVTGDKSEKDTGKEYWADTHPDAVITQRLEWAAAWIFFLGAIASFQIALLGLAIGYALLAIMHSSDWGRPGLQTMTWIPFTLIATGIGLGGLSLVGLQPVFFGFGFHF
jgi:cellulose synthase/poly-beta-1,6-N-acetylglucosamine synthase-like glycosyltransferase